MHLSRKAKVACGIGIAAVIIAGVVGMSSTQRVTPRCHPKLIERPDVSFELVEVKTKHYSELGYWAAGSIRGRALVARDKVLTTLRLRKSGYLSPDLVMSCLSPTGQKTWTILPQTSHFYGTTRTRNTRPYRGLPGMIRKQELAWWKSRCQTLQRISLGGNLI